MAQDTLLGFPAHTLPYRRGEFTTLSTASPQHHQWCWGVVRLAFTIYHATENSVYKDKYNVFG